MDIRSGIELPARREDIELHTADGLDPRRRAGVAADGERRSLPWSRCTRCPPAGDSWTRTSSQGGCAAARPRRDRGAEVQLPRRILPARHLRGALGARSRRAARPGCGDGLRRRARPSEPVAARLVVRHRDRPPLRTAAPGRRRDPAVAAAETHHGRGAGGLGRQRQAPDRGRPGTRHLPAAGRGARALLRQYRKPRWWPSKGASTSGWGSSRPGAC